MSRAVNAIMAAASVGLLSTLDPTSYRRRRPAGPVRSRLEKRYRDHANRRRKFALQSKRRNRR